MVTVAEWLDGSFESQIDFQKPNGGSRHERAKINKTRV